MAARRRSTVTVAGVEAPTGSAALARTVVGLAIAGLSSQHDPKLEASQHQQANISLAGNCLENAYTSQSLGDALGPSSCCSIRNVVGIKFSDHGVLAGLMPCCNVSGRLEPGTNSGLSSGSWLHGQASPSMVTQLTSPTCSGCGCDEHLDTTAQVLSCCTVVLPGYCCKPVCYGMCLAALCKLARYSTGENSCRGTAVHASATAVARLHVHSAARGSPDCSHVFHYHWFLRKAPRPPGWLRCRAVLSLVRSMLSRGVCLLLSCRG